MKKTSKLIIVALCLFSYSLVGLAKTIVVSDIDDTLKKANSMGGIGGYYHFLRKKPYEEIRDLFNEIKTFEKNNGEEISYYYVSAAPSYTFDGDKWIRENFFPIGPVILKTKENGGDTYTYKYRVIKEIIEAELKKDPSLKIYFFGDNSQQDMRVYYDLRKNMNLSDVGIFIRDVSTEATYFSDDLPVKKLDNVDYFFSERELIDNPHFLFMSDSLKKLIVNQYKKKVIVPPYTLDTLQDRIKEICKNGFAFSHCKSQAKEEAADYWNDYFHRY